MVNLLPSGVRVGVDDGASLGLGVSRTGGISQRQREKCFSQQTNVGVLAPHSSRINPSFEFRLMPPLSAAPAVI
ncbi:MULTISPECIES: hypothetical protein [Nocardia]|uniref:hypothetical protein n=1 Tax=Nocardia TaxID=1817 RepID=UPI0011B207C9|nr:MULTISPECIES: hypothetical protein [Nocardia]